MSRNRNEELEDKYASKAVSFKAEPITINQKSDDFGGLQHLNSEVKKIKDEKDAIKPKGLIQRKFERILGGVGEVKVMFWQGFKMGFIVGSIFGGILGIYSAIQYRVLYIIPGMALSSGASFGFFMGVGMIMRNEMEAQDGESDDLEMYKVMKFNPHTREISYSPMHKRYQE